VAAAIGVIIRVRSWKKNYAQKNCSTDIQTLWMRLRKKPFSETAFKKRVLGNFLKRVRGFAREISSAWREM